ncbi:MAG: hypothetical protein MUE52_09470 [Tabrizicola sp.]|jgi:hypothetical protein|nr:hypothetical protein [Tabrizicola sp.]
MKHQLSSWENTADADRDLGGAGDGSASDHAGSLDVLVTLLEQAAMRSDLRQEKQAPGSA